MIKARNENIFQGNFFIQHRQKYESESHKDLRREWKTACQPHSLMHIFRFVHIRCKWEGNLAKIALNSSPPPLSNYPDLCMIFG